MVPGDSACGASSSFIPRFLNMLLKAGANTVATSITMVSRSMLFGYCWTIAKVALVGKILLQQERLAWVEVCTFAHSLG